MSLPPKIPKKPRRATRWKSQAHRDHVRGHACANCGSMTGIEVAHVRMNSGAGMGEKPDDWRTVSLCGDCHQWGGAESQHSMGEPAFWERYRDLTGQDVEDLIAAFIKSSPKRAEIEAIQRERANV